MAYFMIGHCVSCGKPFTLHPDFVPSVRVDGEREPICMACAHFANPKRERRRGSPPSASTPRPTNPRLKKRTQTSSM